MVRRPWFVALWAIAAFWIWAFHVATGFFDGLIAAHSGKRSGIVGMLNSVTEAVLIAPFGRSITVALLVLAGVLAAALVWRIGARGDAGER